MGEYMSNINIFADGKLIGKGTCHCQTLAPVPTECPGEGYSGMQSFELTGIASNAPAISEMIDRICRSVKFSREEVKRMFHAVTHRQCVVFDIHLEMTDGSIKSGEIVCRLPRQLREFFRHTYHLRCPYRIERR